MRRTVQANCVKKVLLIRLDKIGDLICTLPVDQVLDESLYDVTWIVQKGLGQVVDLGQKKRQYIELDKTNVTNSRALLREFLKAHHFDFAISFQCPWWVNFELLRARIRIRSGVMSQWHSFLFLNYGLRQKRSKAIKHELDYNLDLIYETFKLKPSKQYIQFHIDPPEDQSTLRLYSLEPKKYIVVHPGMMGSALNWPQSRYIEKINELLAAGHRVVITGTASDEVYLTEIKKTFFQHPQVLWLQSQLNMKELIQILAYAQYVIVPSTGVAHLAASVGTSVKAIFSPLRVQHPTRWAPRGPDVEIWMIDTNSKSNP